MQFSFSDLSQIVLGLGILSLTTNVITEVLKKVVKQLPAQITALMVSVILTVGVFFAFVSINNIKIEWYMIGAAVILGFFVTYIAQFGFDKFKEIVKRNTDITINNTPVNIQVPSTPFTTSNNTSSDQNVRVSVEEVVNNENNSKC